MSVTIRPLGRKGPAYRGTAIQVVDSRTGAVRPLLYQPIAVQCASAAIDSESGTLLIEDAIGHVVRAVSLSDGAVRELSHPSEQPTTLAFRLSQLNSIAVGDAAAIAAVSGVSGSARGGDASGCAVFVCNGREVVALTVPSD
jgi:hypothetical protein